MPKPSLPNYLGDKPANPGSGRIRIQTNAPQVISASLYYELMVIHETVTGRQQQKWLDRVYKDLEKFFGDYIDRKAASDPRKLHHVYEWNAVGDRRYRLWRLKRAKGASTTGFRVNYSFVQSRRVAPIAPALKRPGANGKVVKKTYAFKKKAYVMENGIPIVNKPRPDNPTGWIAFPANTAKGIAFSRRAVHIPYPGGLATKGAFARTFSGFFRSGLAMKYMKPTLEKPLKVMKRAGEDIPVTIKSARFNQRISKAAVEQMAAYRVQQEAMGVY